MATFGAAATGESPSHGSRRVALELFTSQGCSSCPRAEELLSRIAEDAALRDRVVPLAFHVDYWDGLGWTDPFGRRAWSLRQDAYGRALRLEEGVYTPQLVVDGQAQLVGSKGPQILEAIRVALLRPSVADVYLDVRLEEGRRSLVVAVAAEVRESVGAGKLLLRVALFESGLRTRVGRGENAGRTLRNDFIVRRLETALTMPPTPGRRQGSSTFDLNRDWKPEHLGAAALLQDAESMRIVAATSRGVAAAAGPE